MVYLAAFAAALLVDDSGVRAPGVDHPRVLDHQVASDTIGKFVGDAWVIVTAKVTADQATRAPAARPQEAPAELQGLEAVTELFPRPAAIHL